MRDQRGGAGVPGPLLRQAQADLRPARPGLIPTPRPNPTPACPVEWTGAPSSSASARP
ncbi:hypothetical protein MICRO11B_40033 [Micrococcus luteus]|nr:hypothetical protein MICRO11B_40033 [Micrococcus luteus]